MSLNIIIIGAGIAGLTAAISLCQAGHSVKIFEKSKFATEIGAALNLNPNGAVTLAALGFSFDRALVRRQQRLESVCGETLKRLGCVDLRNSEHDFGAPLQSVLRSDLHQELLHLATHGSNQAALSLDSPIRRIYAAEGRVELESGETYTADLIIAADGIHSIGRGEVFSNDLMLAETGMNAFRFLIPTENIEDLQSLKSLIPGETPGVTIFIDTKDKDNERHLVWYDCHG
ncbi:hypothetical protein MMC30_008392 [Trapelia coarctata]|nr:hypothetical protein [Trapelia coarctata]